MRCNSGGVEVPRYTNTILTVKRSNFDNQCGIGGIVGLISTSGGNGSDTQALDANNTTLAVAME